MTPEQRHICMSHIKSKNTKLEMIVRQFLFAHGFRYRIHVKTLPGKPDIVLRKYKTVILINGCFWHGHENCNIYSFPKSNIEYWKNKIERNKERDLNVRISLRQLGWHVIQLWECQLKPKRRVKTLTGLELTLNHIFLMNIGYKTKPYEKIQPENIIAAESLVNYNINAENSIKKKN